MSPFALRSGRRLACDIGLDELRLAGRPPLTLAHPLPAGLPDPAALAALSEALLNTLAPQPGDRWEITLSDRLCRQWVMPCPAGLRQPAEIAALAACALEQLFGDPPAEAARWQATVDARPFARQWAACAVPQALLASLQDLAAEHAVRLVSVQPRFIRALARRGRDWLPEPAGRCTAYVLTAGDACTIGLARGGEWLSLRSYPPPAALGLNLDTLLRRECRAAGVDFAALRVRPLAAPVAEPASPGEVRSAA